MSAKKAETTAAPGKPRHARNSETELGHAEPRGGQSRDSNRCHAEPRSTRREDKAESTPSSALSASCLEQSRKAPRANLSGWQTVKLGEVFSFKNGRAFKKEEWSAKGLPIIRIQNLNDRDAAFNYFDGEYSPDILVEHGDLLFSWSGTVGTSFGSHLWDRDPGVLNQHIFKVGLRAGIEKRYAFYALRHITTEIEQAVNGAVGLAHITKENLNEFEIPFPPLPEQRRIVGILDEALAGIAAAKAHAERNRHNARALFESHLHAVFSHPGPGSTTVGFSDVCEISSALVDPRQPEYQQLVHVGGANIESKTGELLELKTAEEEGLKSGKFLFDPTMVLYSKIRPYLMKVARPDFEGLCSADIYPLAPKKGRLSRDFLFHLLLTPEFTEYAIAGSARAGMPKVNREHLFAFRFTLPPMERQKAIARQLDALAAETRRLEGLYERKAAALDELKQSLLHQAFSGQL